MNSQNVKVIKVEYPHRTLNYEVVFFTRLNDLRSPGVYGDRRKIGNNIGDGWNDEYDIRHLLNENVDDFIKRLNREGIDHELIFEREEEKVA